MYEVVKQGITENYGLPDNPNAEKEKEEEDEKEHKAGPFQWQIQDFP